MSEAVVTEPPLAATPAGPARAGRGPFASKRREAAAPRPAVPGPALGPGRRWPVLQRLGFRLAALLAVALLPLGVISLLQADAWFVAAREQRAAVLMGETLGATAPIVGLIREARATAATLARTVAPYIGDDARCDALMTDTKAAAGVYSVVAFVPRDGRMTCASDGATFDYAGIPLFEQIIADLRPRVDVQSRGPVSATSIILVVEPVADPAGGPGLGYVGIAIPHAALATPGRAPGGIAPDYLTFNGEGVVLTSSRGDAFDPAHLPGGRDLAQLAAGGAATFSDLDAAGGERVYSVVPMIPGQLLALGSVPAGAVSLGPVSIVAPFLLAALMWAGSLVVAWIAAEHLVTRHIRRLGRAIRAFASGSRVVGDLDMEGAPAEIREVGQAFLRMTDTILHDEAELEDTVHQREVLLREVHHRVKNNLQLIASIMNMQMRRARSPETRALMKGLQDRVMSLATVHKELYQTSGLTDVRADELLGDLVRQIVGMASAPGRTFRIDTDLAAIPLAPDQAVPLSLLLTEGLTNAIKYATPAEGEPSPRIRVAFAASPEGRAELVIRNAAAPEGSPAPAAEGTGLGSQLVGAFATQLGGEVRTELEDGVFTLRVGFVLSSLRQAEEGQSG